MFRSVKRLSKDESGFALMMSMMIMAILTILGTQAIRFASTEIAISSYYRDSSINFYASDAATRIAKDRLDNLIGSPANTLTGDGAIGNGNYSYTLAYTADSPCTGCGTDYRDFFYTINGKSPSSSSKGVKMIVSKIMRVGY